MSRKLAVWISILVTVVLLAATGVYYYQSRQAVAFEVRKTAEELLRTDRRTVSDFLKHISSVTYGIYVNPTASNFIYEGRGKAEAEALFMDYCENLQEVQAVRLVDKDGRIQVFMRECELLSAESGYEPIDLSGKDFLQAASKLKKPETLFSKFERGFLPDAVSFCPSMIRTIIPYFSGGDIAGYLIVNFWGERLGEVVNRSGGEGYSFIAESSRTSPERNGIFLFHKNKSYEFANQMHHNHTFQTIYGEEVFEEVSKGLNGVIRLKNGDYLGYTTVFPYEGVDVSWKICNITDSKYAFRNLHTLKLGFIIVLCLSVFMAFITAFIFAERFLRPLGGLKKTLEHYGRGELDYVSDTKYTDELGEIADKVQEMAASLRKYIAERETAQKHMEIADRLASLSILSAGVSHELSTPLNSILLAAGFLEKQYGSSAEVEAVKTQAVRCVDIISSMRRLVSDGYDSCPIERINLKDTVNETVRFMRAGKDIKIHTELEDIYIDGCRTLIGQVLLNIAVNAVDAVLPSGNITFRLFRENSKAVLEVTDDGQGIDPEKLETVFDPFFTTKSPEKGTGLGLSITHRIVTEHGGTIRANSVKGKGTTIRCEFNESCNS